MARVVFVCGSDNDGYPTCQGDGSFCGWERERPGEFFCAELDKPADPE